MAIIAILVAIAIPVFTTQMNKANAATDAANIRAGYADAQTKALMKDATDGAQLILQNDGTAKVSSGNNYKTKGSSEYVGDASIGGLSISSSGVNWTSGQKITYTIGSDGSGNLVVKTIDGDTY